ncbi:MAG: penicillin-binding transpeptidase domain-containing protein [Desulfococcaceae bacterium]
MKPNRRIRTYGAPQPGWRRYQNQLRGASRRSSRPKPGRSKGGGGLRWPGLLLVFLVALYGVRESPLDSAVFVPAALFDPGISSRGEAPGDLSADLPPPPLPEPSHLIDKTDVQALLTPDLFLNLTESDFDFAFDGRRFRVETTLDAPLQRRMAASLQPETARYLGAVVLEAETGRVLAMVSHDSVDPGNNACLASLFPAASVFKIVTAAAAISEIGLRGDSYLGYAGGKYTLYKYQLRESPGRKVYRISLRDSFAQSVNPVFGRLGTRRLGKTALARHGEAFGFNRPIPFEIPVDLSPLRVTDEPFQWAEVASGFNRTTLLSPLHGAMIAAATVSENGQLIAPTIVDRIRDENGLLLYQAPESPASVGQAIAPEAAREMRGLMEETIRTGTCRRSFRGFEQDPVLGRLVLGGKTGTMGSRIHPDRLYDWFVGFAEEKEGGRRIAVAVAVAHEKLIGTKANEYARSVMETFFANQFARESGDASATSG